MGWCELRINDKHIKVSRLCFAIMRPSVGKTSLTKLLCIGGREGLLQTSLATRPTLASLWWYREHVVLDGQCHGGHTGRA